MKQFTAFIKKEFHHIFRDRRTLFILLGMLIMQIEASNYFDVQKNIYSYKDIETAFRQGDIKLAVVFPQHFNEDLQHFNKAQVQLVADASDPNVANTLTNYASAIIMDYQDRIRQLQKLPYTINTETRMLYNP